MITEDQKKKYEEAAKEYALRNASVNSEYISEKSFQAGAEHAHPIAHSDGKKEGWNEALDIAIKEAEMEMDDSGDDLEYKVAQRIIEELKRLKR